MKKTKKKIGFKSIPSLFCIVFFSVMIFHDKKFKSAQYYEL